MSQVCVCFCVWVCFSECVCVSKLVCLCVYEWVCECLCSLSWIKSFKRWKKQMKIIVERYPHYITSHSLFLPLYPSLSLYLSLSLNLTQLFDFVSFDQEKLWFVKRKKSYFEKKRKQHNFQLELSLFLERPISEHKTSLLKKQIQTSKTSFFA